MAKRAKNTEMRACAGVLVAVLILFPLLAGPVAGVQSGRFPFVTRVVTHSTGANLLVFTTLPYTTTTKDGNKVYYPFFDPKTGKGGWTANYKPSGSTTAGLSIGSYPGVSDRDRAIDALFPNGARTAVIPFLHLPGTGKSISIVFEKAANQKVYAYTDYILVDNKFVKYDAKGSTVTIGKRVINVGNGRTYGVVKVGTNNYLVPNLPWVKPPTQILQEEVKGTAGDLGAYLLGQGVKPGDIPDGTPLTGELYVYENLPNVLDHMDKDNNHHYYSILGSSSDGKTRVVLKNDKVKIIMELNGGIKEFDVNSPEIENYPMAKSALESAGFKQVDVAVPDGMNPEKRYVLTDVYNGVAVGADNQMYVKNAENKYVPVKPLLAASGVTKNGEVIKVEQGSGDTIVIPPDVTPISTVQEEDGVVKTYGVNGKLLSIKETKNADDTIEYKLESNPQNYLRPATIENIQKMEDGVYRANGRTYHYARSFEVGGQEIEILVDSVTGRKIMKNKKSDKGVTYNEDKKLNNDKETKDILRIDEKIDLNEAIARANTLITYATYMEELTYSSRSKGTGYYIDALGREIDYLNGNKQFEQLAPGVALYMGSDRNYYTLEVQEGKYIFRKLNPDIQKDKDKLAQLRKKANEVKEQVEKHLYTWEGRSVFAKLSKAFFYAMDLTQSFHAIAGAFGYEIKTQNFANGIAAWLQDPQQKTVSEWCYQSSPQTASTMVAGPTGLPAAHVEGRRYLVENVPVECPYNPEDNSDADNFCKKWDESSKCGEEALCVKKDGDLYLVPKKWFYVVTLGLDARSALSETADKLKFEIWFDGNNGKKRIDINGKKNPGGETIELAKKDGSFDINSGGPLIRTSKTEYDRVCIKFLNNPERDFNFAFYNNLREVQVSKNYLCNDFVSTSERTSKTTLSGIIGFGFADGGWDWVGSGGGGSSGSEGVLNVINDPSDSEV